MRILFSLAGVALSCVLSAQAFASCGSNSLGTSRTIKVDASDNLHIRGKERSLGLRDKEVILTFDDGPIAGKTPRILNALKKECVKATFFYVGRMAKYQPKMVRRVVREGHTLAHHTHNHNNLPKYSSKRASKLIDKGIGTLQKIAYGKYSTTPKVPFFRYPYLARNKSTDRMLRRKGLIAFGANIDALDWKRSSPGKVHNRIMRKLRREGRGIILMHDIQGRTAKMLPRLLRSLKAEGYQVVHMVPAGGSKPKEDPVLVASVEVREIKPIDDLPVLKKKLATPVGRPVNESETVQDNQVVPTILVSARYEPKQPLKSVVSPAKEQRTGVTLANPQPGSAVEASAPVPNSLKPKKVRIKKPHKTKKRQLKVASAKRKLVVLAGRTKKRRVKVKNWKLRSSQWIIR